ncbi:complement factor B-like [Ambystoma mexicanum]|uniref:complement factor B-like n=1 Tax=Ambystoma mexicanum TaxID=8296 RepID=UPI0037E717B6
MTSVVYFLLITLGLLSYALPATMESYGSDANAPALVRSSLLRQFVSSKSDRDVAESPENSSKKIEGHPVAANILRQEELTNKMTANGHLPTKGNTELEGGARTSIMYGHSSSAGVTRQKKVTNNWTAYGHSPKIDGRGPKRLRSIRTIGEQSSNNTNVDVGLKQPLPATLDPVTSRLALGSASLEVEHGSVNTNVVNSTKNIPLSRDNEVKRSHLTLLFTAQTPVALPRAAIPSSENVGKARLPPFPTNESGPVWKVVQEKICDDMQVLVGGRIVWPEKRTVGSMLKHICPQDHRAFPVSWRVCNSFGQWSYLQNAYGQISKTASCKPVTCLGPSNFEHGFFHPRQPVYSVSTTISFECYAGFQLLGSPIRTCLPNGKWSGEQATCQNHVSQFLCPDPGIPIGGSRKGNHFGPYKTVSYNCGKYELRGSADRECLSSGKWSGEPPRCESWMTFDDSLDVEKELDVLETQIRLSVQQSDDLSLNPLAGKSHKIFFVVEASANVGQENFGKGLNFVKKVIEKVSKYSTKVDFGVVLFQLTPTVAVRIEDGWSAMQVIKAIEGIRYKDLITTSGANIYGALKEVLKSITEDSAAASTKYTIIILTCRHHTGRNPSFVKNEIARHAEKTSAPLDILAIGIGDIAKKDIESLVLSKDTEEEGRQYAFYLPYYEDLDKIYSSPPQDPVDLYSKCGVQGTIVERPLGRIFKGTKASVGDWPWQAYISLPGNFCGGSVIGKKWILSAAHCFDDEAGNLLKPKDVLVSVGNTSTKEKQSIVVEDIIQHEQWNATTKDYDIALLKLQIPLVYSEKVRHVCLPCVEAAREVISPPNTSWSESCKYQENLLTMTGDEEKERTLSGYVAGWGFQKKKLASSDLLHTKVDIKPRRECYTRLGITLTENMFCARGLETDACRGDSGGPLVMKIRNRWIQAGIVSFGRHEQCGEHDFMGFYSSVPKLMGWIQSKTGIK